MSGMTTTRNLMCNLSEEELTVYSRELAEQTQAKSCLEEEKKSVNAEFTSKISRHAANISDLARKITSKQEMRDVDCEWTYLWEDGVKYQTRLDTGAEIDRQKIHDHERQPDLELEDNFGEETGVVAEATEGDTVEGDGSGEVLPMIDDQPDRTYEDEPIQRTEGAEGFAEGIF